MTIPRELVRLVNCASYFDVESVPTAVGWGTTAVGWPVTIPRELVRLVKFSSNFDVETVRTTTTAQHRNMATE